MELRFTARSLSAERFLEHGQAAPTGVRVSTNVNITSVKSVGEGVLVSFITSITYSPSIAQVTIRGDLMVSGEKEKISEILNSQAEKRPVPSTVVESILGYSIVEATTVAKTLNIPPPFPLPRIAEAARKDKKPGDLTYVT